MPAPLSVNLLPKDAFLSSVVGKFLLWSLSIGRYLIIFTELIVILSFLSRFKLDRDLTDVNEKIEVQKRIILSLADTEAQFNSVKTRIEAINQTQENQIGISTLSFLEKTLPIDIKLEQISFNSNGWVMEGSALSAQSLRLIAEKVLVSNQDSSVSLSKIKLNSRTGAIEFGISVRFKTNTQQVKTSTASKADDGI